MLGLGRGQYNAISGNRRSLCDQSVYLTLWQFNADLGHFNLYAQQFYLTLLTLYSGLKNGDLKFKIETVVLTFYNKFR